MLLLWWHLSPLPRVVAVEAGIVLGQLSEPAHLAKTLPAEFLHYIDHIALGHQALRFQGPGSAPPCGHHLLYSAYPLRFGPLVLLLPHVSTDNLLEAWKTFNHVYQQQAATLFITSSLVFYTHLVEDHQILYHILQVYHNSSPFFGYYFFNLPLVML